MFVRTDILPFEKKVWMCSPTMHGEEIRYVQEACETNQMSTIGENIGEIERLIAEKVGVNYALGLSCGTAALHLCMKLAGVKSGVKVACSDMTFGATVNPVRYEGGEPFYRPESGKSCPTEILETLAKFNAEGRPIWKPMHLQPLYRSNPFVTAAGEGRESGVAHAGDIGDAADVGADIFARGLCLPSDNKMTDEEQARVIEIVRSCFA